MSATKGERGVLENAENHWQRMIATTTTRWFIVSDRTCVHRVSKCHIFYTNQILGKKFSPQKIIIFGSTKYATKQRKWQYTTKYKQNH